MTTPTRSRRTRLRRFRRSDGGSAAVEFAIIVPILFLILFAVIDFGRLLWTTNALSAAVREGARAAAVLTDPSNAAQQTTIKTKVTNYILSTLSQTVSPNDVSVSYSAGTGLITVQLSNYTYSPITPFASRMGLGSRTIPATAVFRWERAD